MGHSLTIAKTRFMLTGELELDGFDSSFNPFLDTNSSFDLECEIILKGADKEVSALPRLPDEPWSFRVNDDQCDIQRRNEAGETLWRVSAPSDFKKVTVSWNPSLFETYYHSYEKAWGTGLGLSFVILRLRELGGLVFHGSASVLDGHGILCVGVSGQGKSTIANLFDAEGATVLTDEHPVLRQEGLSQTTATPPAKFRVYGSPWPSSSGFASNENAPLKRIYFLEHGVDNQITRLSTKDAISRLIHVAIIPWQDPALFDPCLSTVEALLDSVPTAVLSFRPDQSVVDAIRQDLASERGLG